MKFTNITVAGSGVLGSQIAFQTAFKGFHVTVYDINQDALSSAKERIYKLESIYENYFTDETAAVKSAQDRIQYTSNLAEAVHNADLVIEAIPEKLEIKQSFYKELSKLAPDKTIFATNSSTLVPSQLAPYTDRPEKFLALHFANSIWEKNTGEVMGHPGTDPEIINATLQFASAIGMVPLHIQKEQPGYILNALLVPFLEAAQALWAKGVADPHTIDKTWMIATGAPLGPFAIIDVVGLQTVYNIVTNKAAAHTDPENNPAAFLAKLIKAEMAKGRMGIATGEGFYKYPNPEYKQPAFLQP